MKKFAVAVLLYKQREGALNYKLLHFVVEAKDRDEAEQAMGDKALFENKGMHLLEVNVLEINDAH